MEKSRLTSLAVALFLGAFALVSSAHGQAVTILNSALGVPSNSFGGQSYCSVVQGSDGFFYGATTNDPQYGYEGGTFKISPQGQLTTLSTNTPSAGVFEGTDGNFYGSRSGYPGSLFQLTSQGTFDAFYTFQSSGDGNQPNGGLIEGTDGNLYGTTSGYQTSDYTFYSGAVFKVTPDGTETILHIFGDGTVANDGNTPAAGLVQGSDGNFYGTTEYSNGSGTGTVFKITPQGTLTIIHSFKATDATPDGEQPVAALVQGSDGNFYGTTEYGGAGQKGTIFKVSPQGTESLLHSFGDGSISEDGENPTGALLLAADGNFYGTTSLGGDDFGTIFELTPQGKYTVLHRFNDGTVVNDGANPPSALVQGSDGNLYGVTSQGGISGTGTFFKVTLHLPALTSGRTIQGNLTVPLTYQVVATQNTTSYSASNLPQGLTIDQAKGLITGTPTQTGSFTAVITMTNAYGSNTSQLFFQIDGAPAPMVTSALNAYGSTTAAFSYTITATGSPTSYAATGLSGTGLSLLANSAIISGTPTTTGTFPVTLTATNGVGPSTAVVLLIHITGSVPTPSQEYVVLHQFNDGSVTDEGEYPSTIFQGFDGTLYGATQTGGTGKTGTNDGTIFNITTQGTPSILTSLGAPSNSTIAVRSQESLVQASDGNFYGTVANLGNATGGYFYRADPFGKIIILHQFGDGSVANDGTSPNPGLIQGADGSFYGTTEFGGSANQGCVYRVTLDGAVTILRSFGDGNVQNDGQYPTSGVIQGTDGNFYGTTFGGGSATANAGIIFKLTPQGQMTILHSFGDGSVNNDGAQPSVPLVLGDDGNFYSTTQAGGSFESGCVFKMTPAGVVTILHSFGDGSVTNDGDTPMGPLVEGYDANYYGTTALGGSAGEGTVFEITSTGVVTIIHSFSDGTVTNDGAYPTSICQASDGNLYGTTQVGGSGVGFGTVFAILANLTPVHVPIYIGSAYGTSPVDVPLTFIPKVIFGVSGTGVQTSGIFSAIESLVTSLFNPGPSFAETYWTLGGSLPANLTFDSTTGTISGSALSSGTYTVTLTPHNTVGAGTATTVTLYINVPPAINSSSTAAGSALAPFSYSITCLPNASSFGATGLPSWLTVDTNTGILSGTPPNGGSFAINAVATNFAGNGTEQIVLNITGGSASAPALSSAITVNGVSGVALSYQIRATNTPTSYSALVLPTGLSCSPTTGLISGTPTTAGTFSVPISITNGSGTTGAEVTFIIAATGAPVIPGPLSVIGVPGVNFSYQIPVDGAASLYAATNLPNGLGINPLTGIISGVPTNTGTTMVGISVTNGSGTSSAMLSLTVTAPTPVEFSGWANEFGVTGSESATSSDDGVPNLIKYAFDIDPNTHVSPTDSNALPQLGTDTTSSPGTTYLTLTYRRSATLANDVQINLQTSTDLKNWSTVSPDISQQVGTLSNTGDSIIEVGVIVNGTGKKFLRLNVTSSQ